MNLTWNFIWIVKMVWIKRHLIINFVHCGFLWFLLFLCCLYFRFTVDFSSHFLLAFYQGIKNFTVMFIQPQSNVDLHYLRIFCSPDWRKLFVTLTSLLLLYFMKRKQWKLLGKVSSLYPYFSVKYNACNYERPAVLAKFPVSWGCVLVLHCVCCAGGQNWN